MGTTPLAEGDGGNLEILTESGFVNLMDGTAEYQKLHADLLRQLKQARMPRVRRLSVEEPFSVPYARAACRAGWTSRGPNTAWESSPSRRPSTQTMPKQM